MIDGDPRAIQQINFIENLNQAQITKLFIIDEAKGTILFVFFTRNGKSILL